MDILGMPIDDWWEQLIAVYFAGYVPAWFVAYRLATEWKINGEEVFRQYKRSESGGSVLFYGITWPLVGLIATVCMVINALDGSRFLDGKPPKELVAQAVEKKADRLLEE